MVRAQTKRWEEADRENKVEKIRHKKVETIREKQAKHSYSTTLLLHIYCVLQIITLLLQLVTTVTTTATTYCTCTLLI